MPDHREQTGADRARIRTRTQQADARRGGARGLVTTSNPLHPTVHAASTPAGMARRAHPRHQGGPVWHGTPAS